MLHVKVKCLAQGHPNGSFTTMFRLFLVLSHKLITSSPHSIVRWFAKELGVKLNPFIMDDDNTFYLVRGLRKRTYSVKANPDILKYELPKSERGRSPDQLLQRALQKVFYSM